MGLIKSVMFCVFSVVDADDPGPDEATEIHESVDPGVDLDEQVRL